MRILAGIMVATSLSACAVDEADDALQGGNGKADGNNACDVPEYGDGVCHIDLACDVPDVDCYKTFATDAEAAAWLTPIYGGAAVAETDPRFMRGRKLVDQAWAMYQKYVPIGTKLAEKRLGVVVLDEPAANAFVLGDLDGTHGGFVIGIYGGQVADDQTDSMVLGTLLHEMQHLSGMHWLPDVVEDMKKHYVAPNGSEPIGARQTNNPRAEAQIEAWQSHSLVVGDWTDPRLGGAPYGGDTYSLLSLALGNADCSAQATALTTAYGNVEVTLSKLDESIGATDAVMAELRSKYDAFEQCWNFSDQPSLQEVAGTTYEYLFEYFTPEEKLKIVLPAPYAIRQIVEGRRQQQRDAEAKFTMEQSRPWSAARYFSYEEQADDTSMKVMVREQLNAREANSFFLTALGDARGACETAVAAGTVPYGISLSDAHHGTCWRYAHGLQIIDVPSTMARETATIEARQPRIPRPAKRVKPIF